MPSAPELPSIRPYLLRAVYEWCTDHGFTPYVTVQVDDTVRVPREHVKNGEIVLNISLDATSSLKLGNEFIEFKARFSGTAREIEVPIERVSAIYARENGQGMKFPPPGEEQAGGAGAPAPMMLGAPLPGSTRLALRDASKSAPADAAPPPGNVVQLVGEDPAAAAATEPIVEAPGDDGTPRPPAGGAGRPALKRVK